MLVAFDAPPRAGPRRVVLPIDSVEINERVEAHGKQHVLRLDDVARSEERPLANKCPGYYWEGTTVI